MSTPDTERELNTVTTWFGQPVEELPREDLLKVVAWCGEEIKKLRTDRERWKASGSSLGYLMAGGQAAKADAREQPPSDFQKWSVLAYRALDTAGTVLADVEPESTEEADNLQSLKLTIKELCYQALVLNGVLTRNQMDRKFHFNALDTDSLIRQAVSEQALKDLHEVGKAVQPDAEIDGPQCWCTTCRPINVFDSRFVVCPDCGNKRCPRAHNHTLACTNSNDVGQPGSSWEHVKPLAAHIPDAGEMVDTRHTVAEVMEALRRLEASSLLDGIHGMPCRSEQTAVEFERIEQMLKEGVKP